METNPRSRVLDIGGILLDHTKVKTGVRDPQPSKAPKMRAYLDMDKLLQDRRIEAQFIAAAFNWAAMPRGDGTMPAPDTDPKGNNWCGDCVWAGYANQVNACRQAMGLPILVTEAEVVAAYRKYTGFDPADPSTDRGTTMQEMWNVAESKDGLFGARVLARASIDPTDGDALTAGVILAGGVIGSYALPECAQNQVDDHDRQLWDYNPAKGWPDGDYPGKWGGHCMRKGGRSPGGDNDDSWGAAHYMTNAFRIETCQSLELALLDTWQFGTADGLAPNGFAFADLLSDIRSRQ
jgi:hypothetical protein